MPATSTPNHRSIEQNADRLCRQAELLISTLSEHDTDAGRTTENPAELLVDGYARVLALDLDRRKLEREIARLAESGDPCVAERLRELSIVLHRVAHLSDELRARLDRVRAGVERPR